MAECPTYIGRLAPSPTGLLHLGHAATFWQAFQRARAANGQLLFRNDDLDRHRSRPEFVSAMIEDLHWLGITWQGPIINQSERLPLYREAFDNASASAGHIYPCTCSRRDLARLAHAPHEEEDAEPIYDGHCRANIPQNPTEAPIRQHRLPLPRPRRRSHHLHRPEPRPSELHSRIKISATSSFGHETESPAINSPP